MVIQGVFWVFLYWINSEWISHLGTNTAVFLDSVRCGVNHVFWPLQIFSAKWFCTEFRRKVNLPSARNCSCELKQCDTKKIALIKLIAYLSVSFIYSNNRCLRCSMCDMKLYQNISCRYGYFLHVALMLICIQSPVFLENHGRFSFL